MSSQGPILDYASPRKQTRLRLESRSSLDVQTHAGGAIITESLRGKAGAVAAMIFAVFILLLLAGMIAEEIWSIRPGRYDHAALAAFVMAFWILEAIVLVM